MGSYSLPEKQCDIRHVATPFDRRCPLLSGQLGCLNFFAGLTPAAAFHITHNRKLMCGLRLDFRSLSFDPRFTMSQWVIIARIVIVRASRLSTYLYSLIGGAPVVRGPLFCAWGKVQSSSQAQCPSINCLLFLSVVAGVFGRS